MYQQGKAFSTLTVVLTELLRPVDMYIVKSGTFEHIVPVTGVVRAMR